jgi:3-methylcrotonyl-CoA carboxylase alpha subunit
MPKRLHLTTGAAEWTADVTGAQVVLRPGDVALTVTRVDDRLRVGDESGGITGEAMAAGDVVWVSVGGEVFAFTITHGRGRMTSDTRDHDAFTPPMSATVVRIAVKPGDQVRDGDVLIALEAMKMELPIRAPRDGIVRAIHCREGELVQPDHVLLDLE